MRALGRRGGLVGGRARARALSASRRAAIAREAASARWHGPVLLLDRGPRDHGELLAFVAHYGATVARGAARCSLEAVVLRAVRASRRDPALARMLPVFLWRVRDKLDMAKMVALARRRRLVPALGYFLELVAALASWRGFDEAIARLRTQARPDRALLFFHETARNPFEAMAAEERTPAEARRWGLLTGTPTESFSNYFRKASAL
jgi:hypothetical protein